MPLALSTALTHSSQTGGEGAAQRAGEQRRNPIKQSCSPPKQPGLGGALPAVTAQGDLWRCILIIAVMFCCVKQFLSLTPAVLLWGSAAFCRWGN